MSILPGPTGHTFHIPVMGIGFTIDTPVRVGQYGITSVISLVDDSLMEKMRAFYCEKFEFPFQQISDKIDDFRARRITAYLNMMDAILKEKFESLKNSILQKNSEFEKYMELLPDSSALKRKFNEFLENRNIPGMKAWFNKYLEKGSIDVNIMTKIDKENYAPDHIKLPVEFNDAHAALRGFANSDLYSSVVFSAGFNSRLYSYLEEFDDFFPDRDGNLRKKVTLKVSDFKSAEIQGKFLANKGIWVSEYRIESGLNCGGHAFATQGYLMGPILEEFKIKREELVQKNHDILLKALEKRGRPLPSKPLGMKVTAQGGVGTAQEQRFLLEHYQLDSVGWGSPFLLVDEVTNVDDHTRELLAKSKPKDLYLSDISPLGVPFNSLAGNTKDLEKKSHIDRFRPGSPCTKRYAALNSEFGGSSICMASRAYQAKKITQLRTRNLPEAFYNTEFARIVDKSCICVGLGTSALLVNNLSTKSEGSGVSICPGPNMAFFSRKASLKEMSAHIYGKTDIMKRPDRPHMFINELKLYIDYLKKKAGEMTEPVNTKQAEFLASFKANLLNGIEYYFDLFSAQDESYLTDKASTVIDLSFLKEELKRVEF